MSGMKMQKVKILGGFHDKDNFATVYTTGSEVEFTEERAEYLKRLGLVEFEGDGYNDEAGNDSVVIDLLQSWQKIVSDVKKCDSSEELVAAMCAESGGKNRKSVIDAIEARITQLSVNDAQKE